MVMKIVAPRKGGLHRFKQSGADSGVKLSTAAECCGVTCCVNERWLGVALFVLLDVVVISFCSGGSVHLW